ncbi:ABC transporter permease [archaeon]|nr:ABC transporter permease [archaeon]MBT4461239.1 ABC transporter permease [archaeon]MBT7440505.1 ABC transporter permease [archaeon]
MKAIPLISANLKSFMRNWSSVVLLLVFPLILIGTIFLSFSPDGITQIPVGVIDPLSHPESLQFVDASSDFLDVSWYSSLDDCIKELKTYKQYCCLEIIGGDSFILDVHYDNTREPIIWEILERIKTSVDILEAQKSKEKASEILGEFGSLSGQISKFETQVDSADDVIDEYITGTDNSINTLRNAHTELDQSLDQMDQDINDISSTKYNLEYKKNTLYYSTINSLNVIDSYLNSMTVADTDIYMLNTLKQESDDLRDEIEDYNDEAEDSFSDVDNKISTYRMTSQKGRTYLVEIDEGVDTMYTTKNNLYDYKFKLRNLGDDLSNTRHNLDKVGTLNPELIASPVKLLTNPQYVPPVKSSYLASENIFDDMMKGINLIGLQTLFPKLLLLIVIFLSLLISTFICLSEINSPANVRVSTIRCVSFHEFFATYTSSLIIIFPPILIVLVLGYTIFELSIPFLWVFIAMYLLSTTFIMLGMSLSYLVVKESITMLITTFLLMFLLFFSGYILPIERMSTVSKIIAEISPGKISLDLFNQLTFYHQSIQTVMIGFLMLFVWYISSMLITYIIKILRNL